MKQRIAQFIDAAMNRYAPIVHTRSAAAFTTADTIDGADLLADTEAHFDSLPPWQRRDYRDEWPDELWAAVQRHPVGKKLATTDLLMPNQTADDYVRVNRHLFAVTDPPAGAEAMSPDIPPSAAEASATGAGGSTTETDLKLAISRVLRDCNITWPTTLAGILARELMHHYEFRHK